LAGLAASGRMRPRMNQPMSIGVSVTASAALAAMA
jgi:hypothetical protein